MSENSESLKRVLQHIRGGAKGFMKEKLQGRLRKPEEMAPPADDVGLDPLSLEAEKPEDPLDIHQADPTNEVGAVAAGEKEGESEASKKLAAIRALIARS